MASPYLTEERLMIQAAAREFTMSEVLPVANELDPVQGEIPMDLRRKLGELGYFGIRTPEEYGGLGLGVFEYCLIAEELARGWMSVASIIARANGLGCVTHEQLAASARGERIAAFALSEPDAGSDVAGIRCRASRDGDEWVIDGEKRWCGVAKMADCIVLFARTGEVDPERRYVGIEAFLVEKERDAFPPGLTGEPIDKVGYHGMTTWALRFEGLRLPGDGLMSERLSREGDGGGAFVGAMQGLSVARVHTAARAVGLARGALEDATAYAKEREQFGRPIARFQAIRFKLADMATR